MQTLFNFLGSYNKAYKTKMIDKADFQSFLSQLKLYLRRLQEIDPSNEELIKGVFKDYFLNEYQCLLNERNVDLTIFQNGTPQVLFEFKSLSNTSEMIRIDSTGEIESKKSLEELVWYFYNQDSLDITYGIKNLVITNSKEFYVFNPQSFNQKKLRELCLNFKHNKLNIAQTSQLYEEIRRLIVSEKFSFEFCYFDLRKYEQAILEDSLNPEQVKELGYFYKLFQADFLLREFSPKDSNELNSNFYNELLYILGLEEIEDENHKIIIKCSNTPNTLSYLIRNDLNCEHFEDIIELIIIWLNRILFLKLFETQLMSFNGDNADFAFLSSRKIKQFNELNNLFFNVLGKPVKQRILKTYQNIPYLNSALFERTEAEQKFGNISNLTDDLPLKLYNKSVLKNIQKPNNCDFIAYLLDFLDSYNFNSYIVDDKKEIINSSVLGLIFEKLNGYADGSYFTPGFITEYMAKKAIDKVILSKFNAALKSKAPSSNIEELKLALMYDVHLKERNQLYNDIFDSIRICDPACGSGHFLVSCLNYLIYLKGYLGLLKIKNEIEIHNDSLIIFDDDQQFRYLRKNKSSLLVQRTLFSEKANLIKNCLFGVDINPRSVNICRLRLWIELLKNSYYFENKEDMKLLPNIDINIKCGNSLLSQYEPEIYKSFISNNLFDDVIINEYKKAVHDYKEAGEDKTSKKLVKQNIQRIKEIWYGNQLDLGQKKSANFKNGLEWVLEFPEVLNQAGEFLGFDLVIGNPPYGSDIDPLLSYYKKRFLPYIKNYGEIYKIFFALALQLVSASGVIAFITPSTFIAQPRYKDLRSKLVAKRCIWEIDVLGERVFPEAVVPTTITFLTYQENPNFIYIDYSKKSIFEGFNQLERDTVEYEDIEKNDDISLTPNPFIREGFTTFANIFYLKDSGIQYHRSNIGGRKNRGNNDLYERLFSKESNYFENSVNTYYGKQVTKYYMVENSDEFFNLDYKKILKSNESVSFNQNTFNIDKKIVWRQTADKLIAAIDTRRRWFRNTIQCAYLREKFQDEFDYHFILGIFNSKYIEYCYKQLVNESGRTFAQVKLTHLKKLPFPLIVPKQEQTEISCLVKKAIECASQNKTLDSIQNEIDNRIFKLYKISEEQQQEILENLKSK